MLSRGYRNKRKCCNFDWGRGIGLNDDPRHFLGWQFEELLDELNLTLHVVPTHLVEDQFAAALKELVVPPGILKWLQESVSESDLNEQAARGREVKLLEEQHRRLASKLDVLYDDRLEGRISPEMYDRKALEGQNQTTALGRKIAEIRAGAPAQGAIDLMALTSRTADLFLIQPPHEKQAFLGIVLKSAAWRVANPVRRAV